jgi:acetyl esterase
VVLYIHGGGFQLLSKETHWVMGLAFARAGYLVCNMSYRKAPQHPFPAALEDACDALAWIKEHVAQYGGDPSRVVFAGESAGANLAAGLMIATTYRRPEPFARRAWDTGIVPRAVALGCGILQVSDPGRFKRRGKYPFWIADMVEDIHRSYLRHRTEGVELADPLCVLERGEKPDRPLPAVLSFVGTRDPVLDDTRRIGPALERLGVVHEERYYPGEYHAFHAVVSSRAARECWRDQLRFLGRHVGVAVQ